MGDLFSQVNQVWAGDSSITTKTKPESPYMTTRFISLDRDGFLAASYVNRMGTLPPWATLPLLKGMLLSGEPPRNKYPKKTTVPKLTAKKKLTLKRVCKLFNIAEFHGMQVVKLLEMQGFKLDAD